MIASTDADSRAAPDWISATQSALLGADAVGGRVTLDPAQRAALPYRVRRAFLRDIAYRRAVCELDALLDPVPHDPFPRHHQHYGASFAVRARDYELCGGLPPLESSEDVALYYALLRAGRRVRHAPEVRVQTSARLDGRAARGMADALRFFEGDEARVDGARACERRARARAALRRAWSPGAAPPPWLDAPGFLDSWSIGAAQVRDAWERSTYFGGVEAALASKELRSARRADLGRDQATARERRALARGRGVLTPARAAIHGPAESIDAVALVDRTVLVLDVDRRARGQIERALVHLVAA